MECHKISPKRCPVPIPKFFDLTGEGDEDSDLTAGEQQTLQGPSGAVIPMVSFHWLQHVGPRKPWEGKWWLNRKTIGKP